MFQYALFDRVLEGDQTIEDPTLPERIDTILTVLAINHHFGGGWSAALTVPVGWVESEASDGTRRGVSGFGDLRLGVGYELGALWGLDGYAPSVRAGIGVSLPTGVEARFEGADDGLTEVVQLGNGSYGIDVSLAATQFLAPGWALLAPVRYRQPVTRSGSGVFYGPSVSYGLGVLWVPLDWLLLTSGVDGQWRKESESPASGTNVNSGGHWLSAHLQSRFAVTDAFSIALRADVPFYSDVNGRQVVQTVAGSLSFGLTFGGPDDAEGEDGEHGHDHGADDDRDGHLDEVPPLEEHDTPAVERGELIKVIPVRGTVDPATLPVEGRTTVVDFWAPWCEPCLEISAWLEAEVARNPALVVKTINVDKLSEDGQRALLGEDWVLPTLWIHGPDRERTHTLEGTSLDVVRDALRP